MHDVRARHLGRSLQVQLHIAVDPDMPLAAAHDVAESVRHAVVHALPNVDRVDVHVDPAGVDAHAATAHHFSDGHGT